MSKRAASETWRLSTREMDIWRATPGLGREMKLRAGAVLYRQGETSSSFYLIIEGKVEVSMIREDGTSFTIDVMGPGAVCGEAAAFDGIPGFSSANAIEPSLVLRFDASHLDEAFSQNPALALSLIRVFAFKQRIMSRRAQSLSAPSPEVRIGELLARLGGTYGVQGVQGLQIPFLLTHEQIAAMTGTTRVTVTRSLKRLREAGALLIDRQRITIMDAHLLSCG